MEENPSSVRQKIFIWSSPNASPELHQSRVALQRFVPNTKSLGLDYLSQRTAQPCDLNMAPLTRAGGHDTLAAMREESWEFPSVSSREFCASSCLLNTDRHLLHQSEGQSQDSREDANGEVYSEEDGDYHGDGKPLEGPPQSYRHTS
jgi:hypothetical protein